MKALGRWAFPLLLVFASSIPAAANDGVIEINQAKALAGAVTPGDMQGFPVTISRAGSYRLTSNLDVTGLPSPEDITVLHITASNVTVDLNQFTILGATSCTGIPVGCIPSSGSGVGIKVEVPAGWATVLNGTIRGMGAAGIDLGQNGRVDGAVLTQNRVWGINSLANLLVRNCRVTQNGTVGIQAGAFAVIGGNAVQGNGGYGIDVYSFSSIQGNTVAYNASSGIHTGAGSVIMDNAIANNGSFGIEATDVGVGYGRNTLNGNNSSAAQVGGSPWELGPNVCGGDTACP